MKYFRSQIGIIILILIVVPAGFVSAQEGMSFNGAAGLYTVPTGMIGWQREADLGIDLGVTYNFVKKNPIAKIGVSLFKWVEITGAFDFQPDTRYYRYEEKKGNNFDYILGLKLQLPTKKTAFALGGNLQLIHPSYGPWDIEGKTTLTTAGQIYASATYSGSLFGMPTATTVALGYTFMENQNSNVDFGMGFDMIVLPDVFQRYVHWLVDFSNFSYSIDPLGIDTYYRGSLNTGLRIDIGAAPALKKIKLMVDIIATDILDEGNRSFVLGLVFGGIVI
ncbi:MAG: hypothetical protein LBK05_05115 [Treponema sp.]|jgi:hypothetical protein|nr:hypothetical protein [Treponema sp.]